MVVSLLSLLDGVIDYAGLFPPAHQEMSRAVSDYLQASRGADAWMLSRFACPSSGLGDLANVLSTVSGVNEIPVTVIGQSSTNMDEWAKALEHDAKVMNDFVQEVGEGASIEAYEVKTPANRVIAECIRDLKSFQEVDVFVELPWGAGIDDSLAALAETDWLCAKARTGGQTPESFPPASELAEFLHGAVGLDLSFKLTAGLHNPLPKVDRQTGARMHGFLNVLAACGFALAEDMSRNEIEDVLNSATTDDWRFGDEQICWRDSSLSIEEIEDSRELFWSIGSCSIDEVIAGLDAHGLIGRGR